MMLRFSLIIIVAVAIKQGKGQETTEMITCNDPKGCTWTCPANGNCNYNTYICPSSVSSCNLTCNSCHGTHIFSSAAETTIYCNSGKGCSNMVIATESNDSFIILECGSTDSCNDVTFSCTSYDVYNCLCFDGGSNVCLNNVFGTYLYAESEDIVFNTKSPTNYQTISPSNNPTISPSNNPTKSPTNNPTISPSNKPTIYPSYNPTISPSNKPSMSPSNKPSISPSNNPVKSSVITPTSKDTILQVHETKTIELETGEIQVITINSTRIIHVYADQDAAVDSDYNDRITLILLVVIVIVICVGIPLFVIHTKRKLNQPGTDETNAVQIKMHQNNSNNQEQMAMKSMSNMVISRTVSPETMSKCIEGDHRAMPGMDIHHNKNIKNNRNNNDNNNNNNNNNKDNNNDKKIEHIVISKDVISDDEGIETKTVPITTPILHETYGCGEDIEKLILTESVENEENEENEDIEDNEEDELIGDHDTIFLPDTTIINDTVSEEFTTKGYIA